MKNIVIAYTYNDKNGKFGDYGCNEWEGWHHGLYIDWTRKKYGLRKDIGFWTKNREIERIGNIHENPELLR